MLDFVKAERELEQYSDYIIIHEGSRYVPAIGFEFLQRMYDEQKVYVSKLEEHNLQLETDLIKYKHTLRKYHTHAH